MEDWNLINRLLDNLRSQKKDIADTALCLLSKCAIDDQYVFEILTSEEALECLFDMLEEDRLDQRIMISRIIRNTFHNNLDNIELVKDYM